MVILSSSFWAVAAVVLVVSISRAGGGCGSDEGVFSLIIVDRDDGEEADGVVVVVFDGESFWKRKLNTIFRS